MSIRLFNYLGIDACCTSKSGAVSRSRCIITMCIQLLLPINYDRVVKERLRIGITAQFGKPRDYTLDTTTGQITTRTSDAESAKNHRAVSV